MATMTLRAIRLSKPQRRLATNICLIFAFWIVAAAAVAAAHLFLDTRSPGVAAIAAMTAIAVVAFAYMRLAASDVTVDHALAVGISWLVLAVLTEVAVGSWLRHGWFALLGSLQHPLLRNVLLFVWVFAPAIFARARREAGEE